MLDVLVLAAMFAVCGGLGLPIAARLPASFAGRALIAPVLGVAVMAVIVPVTYRWGLSVRIGFFALAGLGIASLGWQARRLAGELRALDAGGRRQVSCQASCQVSWVVACWLGATLVMMLPRWVGGEQFSVFQGNMWDAFGYLESAAVYARKHYAVVAGASDEVLRKNPLYPLAQGQLGERPSVHLLYAAFSRLVPGQAYRLYYPFLVGLLSPFVPAAVFVLRGLLPRARLAGVIALAAMFPLGFWGQYAFDINAWSQIGSAPLFFVLFGLVLRAAIDPPAPGDDLRVAGVLAVVVAGAAYLYPEGFLIYGFALGPVAVAVPVIRMVRARRLAPRPLVPVAGWLGLATIALYPPLLQHVIRQVTLHNGAKVWWWRYFQIFFWGRDGVSDNPIDFAAGLFGLYFATPAADASPLLALVQRIAIAAAIAAMLALVIRALIRGPTPVLADAAPDTTPDASRKRDRAMLIGWLAISALLLAPAALLASQDNYWPAGKIVSYAAPVFMTLLAAPITWPAGPRALVPLRWLAIGFVGFQLALGVIRIPAATSTDGIHYAPPYPAVTLAAFKQDFGWDLAPLDRALKAFPKKPRVRLAPMNPWPEAYLMVYLYTHGYRFTKSTPVDSNFGAGKPLGDMPGLRADVEIWCERTAYVLHFLDGRPDIRAASRGE